MFQFLVLTAFLFIFVFAFADANTNWSAFYYVFLTCIFSTISLYKYDRKLLRIAFYTACLCWLFQ